MGGGFMASSRNVRLENGHRLVAECRNQHGDWVRSELDLNTCIGNLNGYLAWDTPNFSHTAHDVHLVEDGAKLDCNVRQVNGQMSAPQGIRLNDRIRNNNGRLEFIPYNQQ